ncbi:MAG: TIGR00266 family protein [Oscillospiraceae bacterium]|nr:TIGR00266 family protein [Oscillospiraceae bacterium]
MNYKIIGEPNPVVECSLDVGESMKTERGSMVWMSPNLEMETNTGGGGLGHKIGKMLAGESLFLNSYTAKDAPGYIAFGSSFTGSIRAIEIAPGKSVICQKASFLASETGVELEVFLQKKLGAGFFGGEGFIMQKLSGKGMLFIEIDGSAVDKVLAPGERIVVDTGNLVMMEETCSIDIQQVKGLKNKFFGGEGIFNTIVTGPGRIILQTITIPRIAETLIPYLPTKSN